MYYNLNHYHVIITIIIYYLVLTNSTTLNTLNSNEKQSRRGQFNSELCNNFTLNTLSHSLNITLLHYSDIYQYIPNISILIIAHNENAIILENTLKSILINTSLLLLNKKVIEIILVDDFSNPPIEDHIKTFNKIIRIIRNQKRLGLIKSRMNGARNATGEILVFLDAHVETLNHWLEPLIIQLISLRKNHRKKQQLNLQKQQNQEITTSSSSDDPRHFIVTPIILSTSDRLDYDNIEDNLYLGGFSWNLTFRWHHISEGVTPLSIEPSKTTDPYHLLYPRKTPALAGGLFAVWKDDFFHYGGYDEEMSIWGGENIELSLRTWLCHGQIEIIPCSRVGHMFRAKHPYTFPMGKEFTILRNHKRTVLVWFKHDTNLTLARQYLGYFYTKSPMSKIIPAGDLKLRKSISNSLNCHTFTWYLENIYPLLKQEAANIKINEDIHYITAFDIQ
ncbi:hypothetical protein MN116_006419 [Schistosoma mekongi]|uniref:Glycosyltransferase 2-like domain-containing protein n=1 Tax=Schistosoma mekongi TaxID=38744 RepID=A0AAE1ZCB0_SCHME|nr:hypothetical protein MN116_006419 [Schistosoma mekongi]